MKWPPWRKMPTTVGACRQKSDKQIVGYSSFPHWSTLGEILELERERGNYVPKIKRLGLKKSFPAKWVAESKLIAYSYVVPASDVDRVLAGELTEEDLQKIEETVCEIPLLDSDIILTSDTEGGYLIVRREPKK